MKKITSLLVVCAILLTTISSMALVSADVTSWNNAKISATLVSGTFNTPEKVTDGDLSSFAKSTGTWTWSDLHFTIDLGATYDLEGYNLYGGYKTAFDDPYSYEDHASDEYDAVAGTKDNAFRRMPTAWNLYYSLDGNSWLPLTSVTDNKMSLYQGSLDGYKARYIKYEQAGNFGGYCEWGWVRELEVYGSLATGDLGTSYDVNFMVDDEVYHSTTVTEGFAIAEPAKPVINGYAFVGWYSDEALTTKYDFSQTVFTDVTLYAKLYPKTTWTKDKITATLVEGTFRNPSEVCDGIISKDSYSESTGTWTFTDLYFIFDLGEEYDLEGYNLYGGKQTEYEDPYSWEDHADNEYNSVSGKSDHEFKRMPSAWNLYYSDDNITWKPLASVTDNKMSLYQGSLAGYSARYIKYEQAGNFSYCEWGGIREIEFYGTVAAAKFTINNAAYANGAVTATLSNPTASDVTGIVCTAVYSGDALSKVISQPVTVTAGNTDYPFTQVIPASAGNTVKVFMFDGLLTLKPKMVNAETTVK